MKVNVRMVSGPADGDEMQWDIQKNGPSIKVVEHPDFVVCPDCATDEVPPAETFHYATYKIHLLKFDSGHRHHYAAPEPMRVVDLMNVLWHGYRRNTDG